jgi:phosphate transport system ATP-binding protein
MISPSHPFSLQKPEKDFAIIVEDLHFYYKKTKRLNNINVAFEKNKITALIGPSGSGKSTLLRTLNRIYSLYSDQVATGSVLIHGENILHKKTNLMDLRSKVGMVFQKPTPFPMSIFDNVAFALKIHESLSKAQIRERVEWALKAAALWEEVQDHLGESSLGLSGGQQQRLCIARTIAIAPSILLLDEPCSALDPISTQKIENMLLDLKSKFTIIIVTHNLPQAQRISDTTLFMSQGEIVEMAPTQQFFTHPRDLRSQNYIRAH